MTVKELIKLLKKTPSDFQVILSKDSEGNGFSPISGHALGFYLPENVFRGDFTDVSCVTFNKDQMEKAQNAIAFYPTQ